jgi:hypothetical protein
MFWLLNDVPVIGNPIFRILLGAVLIAVAVLFLHSSILLIAVGALILVMGIVRGVQTLTGHAQKGQAS